MKTLAATRQRRLAHRRAFAAVAIVAVAGVAAAVGGAGVSSAHAAAPGDPPATPHDLHAAECVAALEVHTEELAKQVKSGQEASRALLFDRLVAGTAIVGDTYLHGNSDEQHARALAAAALEAQKRLTPAELAERQQSCAREGAVLFDDGNVLEKAVVKRLAKKRMDKLLGG